MMTSEGHSDEIPAKRGKTSGIGGPDECGCGLIRNVFDWQCCAQPVVCMAALPI